MSSSDHWFQSPDWDAHAQELFYEKIKRARGNTSKSQYQKIKALHLIHAGDVEKIDAAIELLKHSLKEFPSEFEMDTDATNEALGDAYRLKGDFRSAVTHYEEALTWSNSRGSAYWEYPEMIVTQKLTDLYDHALAIVSRNAKEDDLLLQYHIFVYHGVRACVFETRNHIEESKKEAKLALEAGDVKTSVFRHHPDIGLIDKRTHPLINDLERMAN